MGHGGATGRAEGAACLWWRPAAKAAAGDGGALFRKLLWPRNRSGSTLGHHEALGRCHAWPQSI